MSLPSEIYLQIFSYINRNELLKLATVSKEWSLPALLLYNEEVILTCYSTEYLKASLDQGPCLRYSLWTEALIVYYEEYQDSDSELGDEDKDEPRMKLTKQEFLKFLSYFPNIKRIEFSAAYVDYECVEYLLAIDTRQHLTRLENIDVAFYSDNHLDDPSPLYYSVYFHFRSSLTRVSLQYGNNYVFSAQYDGLLNYIGQFKKLTHLLYTNDTRLPVTIYDIQLACPTLTSLDFYDKATTPSFQVGSDVLFCKDSNLKNLSISYANIPKSYIEHIIKHLPKSVESLEISMSGIAMYDWIYQVGIDNLFKLLRLMSTLPDASLYFDPRMPYEKRHDNLAELNITTFFKMLHVFKGNKKLRCTASFLETYPSRCLMRFSGKDLIINYGLGVADFFNNNEERVFQLAVPDKTVSAIGLEVIHSMELNITTIDEELPFEFLNYSFNNCPHLQFVKFVGTGDPQHEFILSTCHWKEYDVNGKKYNISTTSKENLKIARIQKSIPSPEFVGLLAVHLPDIHTFIFNCTVSVLYNYKEPIGGRTIDLRHFKKLQIVYFDLKLILNNSCKGSCLIKFEYTDGEEKYYYFSDDDTAVNFKPVSFEEVPSTPECLINTVVFRCEKIEKFTVYYRKRIGKSIYFYESAVSYYKNYVMFDIFQGVLQNNRKMDKGDSNYVVVY